MTNSTQSFPVQTAVSVSSFVASIGINTAIGASWSDYGNFSEVEYALSYLGISNVRDSYQTSDDIYRFEQLSTQIGIKFDFYLGSSSNGADWQIAQIMANPSLVAMVEGPNESDINPQTYGSQTGMAAAYAEQAALSSAITKDSARHN